MAGIAGIIGTNANTENLRKMLETLRHRGKSDAAIHTTPQGVMGTVEMPEPGKGDGSAVLLDGTLYNSEKRAGETDTAFLKRRLDEQGVQGLSRLDGSFACAFNDGDETILARDAVGARPVIYGTGKDGCLYFASEAKALRGFVDEVSELPPAHVYSSKKGLGTFTPYVPDVPDFETPREGAKILRELMVKAVERSMADGQVQGVSLSGGLDSSIVLAIAREFNPRIEASSVSIKRSPGEDKKYAELMAKSKDIKLHMYELTDEDIAGVIPDAVWYLESFDEDCISGFIANYYASKLASGFTNSVLVGEGADELFGGYFRELANIDDEAEKERVARKLVEVAYNTALRRLDRGWMANSVDYRTPYLDPAVVAFSEKIPLDIKVYAARGGEPVEKWILREAFRDMIPAEIADRPKMRFARGVGVDDLMDMSVEGKVTAADFAATPKSEGGLALNSPKELHFYRIFREYFPLGYEGMTARWDPHK